MTVADLPAAATIEADDEARQLTVFVRGELDIAGASCLEAAVKEVAARDDWSVRVDLGGVAFIDASGWRAVRRLIRASVRGATVVGLRGPARRSWDLLTGLEPAPTAPEGAPFFPTDRP